MNVCLFAQDPGVYEAYMLHSPTGTTAPLPYKVVCGFYHEQSSLCLSVCREEASATVVDFAKGSQHLVQYRLIADHLKSGSVVLL